MATICVVGLAGKYCAGKSTVAEFLSQKGAVNIEVDHLGHEVLQACREQVAARFGSTVVHNDQVDRKALGAIVFADSQALADLEAITHPAMVARVRQLIEDFRAKRSAQTELGSSQWSDVVIVNAALLFKMRLDSVCDFVLWVDSPLIFRLWRGLRRDNRGFSATWRLMRSQNLLEPQIFATNADIVKVVSICKRFTFAQVRDILERKHG